MGKITSLFVRKVLGAVGDEVDKAGLMRSVGMDPDSPVDPKYMISDIEYYDFLERLEVKDPRTLLDEEELVEVHHKRIVVQFEVHLFGDYTRVNQKLSAILGAVELGNFHDATYI